MLFFLISFFPSLSTKMIIHFLPLLIIGMDWKGGEMGMIIPNNRRNMEDKTSLIPSWLAVVGG